MLLCLHEEAAVAIAHGYAKVTGKAMVRRGAFQCRADARHHGDVQRLVRPHADAWCSAPPARSMPSSAGRGSTGSTPRATRARWSATTPSGTTSRPRPAPRAKRMLRGNWIANTAPQGPVYINLDAEVQEMKVSEPLPPIDAARYMPPVSTAAPAELVKQAAAMLKGAKQVLILAGRVSRSEEAWNARVALAEALDARVAHRSEDRRQPSRPTIRSMSARRARSTPESCRGPEGRRRRAQPRLGRSRRHAALRSGPSPSRQGDPDFARPPHPQRLEHGPPGAAAGRSSARPPIPISWCRRWSRKSARARSRTRCRAPRTIVRQGADAASPTRTSRAALRKVLGDRPVTYTHLPLSWDGELGAVQASARLSSAPMAAAASAAARAFRSARRWRCKGTGRLPIAICGDGDFLMGVHRGVDRGALQHPAAVRARQQSLVL